MKRSPLLVIFITVFIDLVGFGIVIPVLPFYVEGTKFNASPRMVGLLFASYSVMQLIFTPVLGRLSDKYGRRPVLLVSLLGTALGFLILGFATTLWMLFLGRIIDGISGGNISTAQAYIADVTTPENRAKGMGMIGAAFGLGFTLGPAIGGILSKWGISVPFIFAGCLALANAVLLYFTLPETVTSDHPARASAATGRWSQLFGSLKQRRLTFVLAIYFLFVTAFSIMTTSFALFTMYRFGYDASHNGYLFMYVGILGVIIQGGLIGRLTKTFGELPLIITGALLFSGSLFLIPLVGPGSGLVALLGVGGLFAVGNSLATPTLTALASKSVGRGEQGGVLGVTQSVASLARATGPLIQAALIVDPRFSNMTDPLRRISDHSLLATFWSAAGIMFAAFLLSIYFARLYSGDYSKAEVLPAGG
ncbi:MAG TPA: MFS transporter [Pyrinomonadaceae bacterium]|nr:MFS transporter [Pyrinomonadaceae bacterium]